MPNEPTMRGTAVIFHAVRGANRSRAPARQPGPHRIRVLPGGTHAKEIYAGAVLAVLAVMATTGWIIGSARTDPAPTAPPAEPPKAYQFASNSIYTGSITGATALILIGLIAGAAVVGMLVYSPRPPRNKCERQRPEPITPAHSEATPPKRGRHAKYSQETTDLASTWVARRARPERDHAPDRRPATQPERHSLVRKSRGEAGELTRPGLPARSSRPSSRIRHCSSTSSDGR